jgi:hypothetical protein
MPLKDEFWVWFWVWFRVFTHQEPKKPTKYLGKNPKPEPKKLIQHSQKKKNAF